MKIYYDDSLYTSVTLKKFARAYLKALPRSVEVLLATGHSGAMIASAMAVLRPHLQVPILRKPGEKAHVREYAGYSIANKTIAIVDDLIESGATLKRLVTFAEESQATISCVIVSHISEQTPLRKYSQYRELNKFTSLLRKEFN